MNTAKKASGVAMAAAAATLFLAGCQSNGTTSESAMESKAAQVKCFGINACKGQTQCATASNACAGHNNCKGQGWLMTSKAECDKKGGTVEG